VSVSVFPTASPSLPLSLCLLTHRLSRCASLTGSPTVSSLAPSLSHRVPHRLSHCVSPTVPPSPSLALQVLLRMYKDFLQLNYTPPAAAEAPVGPLLPHFKKVFRLLRTPCSGPCWRFLLPYALDTLERLMDPAAGVATRLLREGECLEQGPWEEEPARRPTTVVPSRAYTEHGRKPSVCGTDAASSGS
jgi:hypothetical protein